MNPTVARVFYNTAGITPRNDPASRESTFAVDRVRKCLMQVVKPGSSVLDIGCGAGRFTFAAEEMGAHVIGIDCADGPLEYARKLAAIKGSQARFVLGDATDLHADLGHFDLVLLIDNLVEFSIDELVRMATGLELLLKAGGYFCIAMQDRNESELVSRGYEVGSRHKREQFEIPDHGRFAYDSYFWTASLLIRTLALQYWVCAENRMIANGRRWLVFGR